MTKEGNHPLDRAVRAANITLKQLSIRLGVTKSAVNQWKLPNRSIPVIHCVKIEEISGGAVGRRDLRPNDWQEIWPDLRDGATN